MLKLNIGAGDTSIPGFTNLDIKTGTNAITLPYADGEADEIYASHVLEHFHHSATNRVLKEWVRVLRPGGRISIAVPDIKALLEMEHEPIMGGGLLQAFAMGGGVDEHDHHRALFWRGTLERRLMALGIENIQPFTDEIPQRPERDDSGHVFSLNLTGVKRPLFPIAAVPKVAMVCSQPRVSFSTMFRGMMETIRELGAKHGFEYVDAAGQSWDQSLQNGMMKAMHQYRPDYILTVDFDGAFDPQDVVKMIELAQSRPDLAAIYPIQMSRHDCMPLVFRPELDYSGELTECTYGHFGLTLIRPQALANLPLPWFYAIPSPEGTYNTPHHSDTDITFWRELAARGYKIAQANRVILGHIVLAVKWPTKQGQAYQPIEGYDKKGRPKEAVFDGTVYVDLMRKMAGVPQTPAQPQAQPPALPTTAPATPKQGLVADNPFRQKNGVQSSVTGNGVGLGDQLHVGDAGSGVPDPAGQGVLRPQQPGANPAGRSVLVGQPASG